MAKNLNMLLMDGTANGGIKCTVGNWTGVAFKIPRDKVESFKNRDELKYSGIYFLFGENEVYIGQAGNRKNGNGILDRIFEHKRNAKKNYWNEAVIFTTSNNYLGSTEISFLENKFCNLAIDAKRYEVKNSNEPSPSNITEEKEIELEEFAEYVQIILEVLGYKVFQPAQEIKSIEKFQPSPIPQTKQTDESPIFYLSRKGNPKFAMCQIISNKYVVLKKSRISPKLSTKDISKPVIDARTYAKENSKIDDKNFLLEDFTFDSPTAAAEFITGVSTNGKKAWKTENDMPMSDFLKSEK